MKKNRDFQNEISALRRELGEGPALPDRLSPENVSAAVSGEKQRVPVRRTVRRAVSLAVAACIALTVTVFWRGSVYAPRIRADAASYQEVGRLMREYNRAQRFSRYSSVVLYSNEKAADSAPRAFNAGAALDSDDLAVEGATVSSAEGGYGKTNTRERDVAEQDVLQTDGRYLYLLLGNGADFRVLDAADGLGEVLRLDPTEGASRTEGDETDDLYRNGVSEFYHGFYLSGSRVVFVGERRTFEEYACTVQTCVKVFDLSDPENPVRTRSLLFDGSLAASRFVNGRMLLVTRYVPAPEAVVYNDYTTFIPKVTDGGETCYLPESSICLGSVDEADSFLTVTSFAPDGEAAQLEQTGVFGGGAEVYCTAETLYVYRACWESRFFFGALNASASCATNILAFDISGDAPVFLAKGCVEGSPINSFSLDAYRGNLRVATTVSGERNGEWFTENRVTVLDGDLEPVGVSPSFGEGESVYGVRFSGDVGYVVTFYQTDPLFVLDLSDPAAPAILGELKLPGFSSYLHPVGEGLLLGLGRGGDEDGLDGSAKATLFDVSDPRQPKEIDSVVIPDAWFHEDYKAFVDMGDGSFLVPLSFRRVATGLTEPPEGTDPDVEYYATDDAWYSGAVRLGAAAGGLAELGRYLYAEEYGTAPRVTFIGDRVFAADRLESCWDEVCRVYTFDRDTYAQTGDPLELRMDPTVTPYVCY